MSEERRRNLMGSKGGGTLGKFGGLMWAPGPLIYRNGNFEILDDWDVGSWDTVTSYGSKYGVVEGSTYFDYYDIGRRFDSRGSSFGKDSGNIDNANLLSYGGYNDWRVPTPDDWAVLKGYHSSSDAVYPSVYRSGGTVNGVASARFTVLSSIKIPGQSHPCWGVLFYPDGCVITGRTMNAYSEAKVGIYNPGMTTDVTSDEINEYVEQGCVFIPMIGFYNSNEGEWSNYYGNVNCLSTDRRSSSKYNYVGFYIGYPSNLAHIGESTPRVDVDYDYHPVMLCRGIAQ